MRRSFQGDALYREVFDEYLHQMFTKGYSVEYFIEGSRSRTGRTLPPRTGMLRMTVRSFQKDSTKPIAFMPVYFGYERVLESSTYMAELSGKDKKSESVFDVFGIFSSFKREFGRVTVNFGEPVLLHDFLDQRLEFWDQPLRVTSASFTDACQNLAELLATRINSAVAVKPTNLVAVALLSTRARTLKSSTCWPRFKGSGKSQSTADRITARSPMNHRRISSIPPCRSSAYPAQSPVRHHCFRLT